MRMRHIETSPRTHIFENVLEAVRLYLTVGVHDDEEVLVDAGVGHAHPEHALAQDEVDEKLQGRKAENHEGDDAVDVPDSSSAWSIGRPVTSGFHNDGGRLLVAAHLLEFCAVSEVHGGHLDAVLDVVHIEGVVVPENDKRGSLLVSLERSCSLADQGRDPYLLQ